jgi:hypothetical protein
MQLIKRFVFLISFLSLGLFSNAQDSDSLGLPGDQLDLYAVLNTFENSKDLADFERILNDEKSGINNIDLKGDGEIDYIRIIDNVEGTSHAIVLQIPMSDTEAQDIAVIEIEKTGNETATLQIVGDSDLYGPNYIIDTDEEDVKTKSFNRIIVNVWLWPSVRFIYGPSYVVYVSPWRWHYYPNYWKPWKPVHYHAYHSHCVVHHHRYHRTTVYRTRNAHKVYASKRVTTIKPKKNTSAKNKQENHKQENHKPHNQKQAPGKKAPSKNGRKR